MSYNLLLYVPAFYREDHVRDRPRQEGHVAGCYGMAVIVCERSGVRDSDVMCRRK